MKALVTGGVGFIGRNLIQRLLDDGHEVVSVDNYSTGFKYNELDGCTYCNWDVSDPNTPYSDFLESPDVIFHLAALARIQPSFEKPTITIDTNFTGTQRLLEWSRTNGKIPLIYAGSSSMHGDLYCNPYTFSKWQGEELCKLYSQVYEVPTTICRFYNVYGPHQLIEGEYCTVVGIFERQYKNGEPLTITWDGEQRRDFTHVDDIVDGLMRCSEHFTFMGEEFELGTGNNYSINEVADAFGGYPREYIPKRPGEMRTTLCTDIKAHQLLNWHPTGDLIEFIKKTYME